MGFPLSTDIFGQLAWLVRQVKILIFRVTRIEQGGGGSAQNINQVLATGNTAANKFLQFDSSVNSSALKIGNDTVNGLSIFLTEDPSRGDVSSTNLTSTGFGQTFNGGDATSNLTASSLIFTNDASSINTTYGSNGLLITGLFGTLGFTSESTANDPVFKTTINSNDAGFYFKNNKTFTIGKETAGSYFGIKTDEAILYAGGIRRTNVDFNSSAGFIPIRIDGNDYYIELWIT